jgi:hypothetical protein
MWEVIIVFDTAILKRLELAIHNHSDYLINKYSNFSGKKKISVIFSAKDWIHTIVHGMPYLDLNHKDDNAHSLNVLQLVCSIDLLKEAVEQLDRVIFNRKNYPLLKDRSVFNKPISDDQYFSHIRAAFGAHPINLKSSDGMDNEKYYASWSTRHGRGDFSVYLYSIKPHEEDKVLTLSFKELICYANKRYNYLVEIINEIKRQEDEYKFSWSQKRIDANSDPVKQLYILRRENESRFGEYGYIREIEELISLFTAPRRFNTEYLIYDDYLSIIKPLIEEIRYNLQWMKFDELTLSTSPHYLHVKKVSSHGYDIQKIYEYIHNPNMRDARSRIPYHLNSMIHAEILPSYTTINLDKRDLLLILNSWLEKAGGLIQNDKSTDSDEINEDIEPVYIYDDIPYE